MIQDFIYYLREYGFKFVWNYKKHIVFNDEFALIFAESETDYEQSLDGILEEFRDAVELGYAE